MLREFDPLGVGFEPELSLLVKDNVRGTTNVLSFDSIRNAYRRDTPSGDLKSSEFKSVLDDFVRLKLYKATDEATKTDRNQSFKKTCKAGLLHSKRRNSTDRINTPGHLGLGFNQSDVRFRRGSLPIVELAAVDIQCSVPISKREASWSIAKNKSICIPRDELPSITEIPNTSANVLYQNGGAIRKRNPADLEAAWKAGRRLSLGRVGVLKSNASNWRIQIHKRKVAIDDNNDAPVLWSFSGFR